jgi:hypothetical protein
MVKGKYLTEINFMTRKLNIKATLLVYLLKINKQNNK